MPLEDTLKEIGQGMIEAVIGVKDRAVKIVRPITRSITHPAVIGTALVPPFLYGLYNQNEGLSYRALTIGTGFALAYGMFAYAIGKWPFKEITEKVYEPLQWFNEQEGRVLQGPDTTWFLRPLEKNVERNKKIVTLPADGQERNRTIKFVTKDGLDGTLRVQYLWNVPSKEDAKQFFWKWKANMGAIDEVIEGELTRRIARIEGVKDSIPSGEYTDENGVKVDFIREAEVEANRELTRINLGVEIKDFSLLEPDYSPRAQKILNTVAEARQKAQADIELAEGAKKSTGLYAEATQANINRYRESLKELVGDQEITAEEKLRCIIALARMDNLQEVAGKGRTIVVARQ